MSLDKIGQYLNTNLTIKLKNRLEKVKELAVEDLRQELLATVYSEKPTEYEWTYELLNSIDSTPVEIIGNRIHFKIFFNSEKRSHTSKFGDTAGIWADVVQLTNEGHHHPEYDTPKLHQYEGWHYIERAMERIKKDLEAFLLDAIKIEIKKIPAKKFY